VTLRNWEVGTDLQLW